MNAWEAKRIAQAPTWRDRIIACRNSGMSVQAWCRLEGISVKTYYRHERMILDMTTLPQGNTIPSEELQTYEIEKKPVFAALPEPPAYSRSGAAAATIHLADYSIDIYDGTSEEMLQTILRVLRHAE